MRYVLLVLVLALLAQALPLQPHGILAARVIAWIAGATLVLGAIRSVVRGAAT